MGQITYFPHLCLHDSQAETTDLCLLSESVFRSHGACSRDQLEQVFLIFRHAYRLLTETNWTPWHLLENVMFIELSLRAFADHSGQRENPVWSLNDVSAGTERPVEYT